MPKKDFILLLDELMELEPGFLLGDEPLSAIPKWDSLAALGFIALLDRTFGMRVPAARLAECKTLDDLIRLAGDKISS